MTLEEKKRYVVEYVKLGMDPYRAYICLSCTAEEIAALEVDANLLADLGKADADAELLYLKRMADMAEANAQRGISVETRWLMEKRWASKYGTKVTQIAEAPELPSPVRVTKE